MDCPQRWPASRRARERIERTLCVRLRNPAHDILLRPFAIASRVVTNGEWRAFIDDGGYRTAGLWLSDGWATVQREGWGHPLYWELHNGEWQSMTLAGMQPIDDDAPVRHVSYFEADAFARWAGKRLPTEHEWEVAATVSPASQPAMAQRFGPVWQWTASPYVAYPGFRPAAGPSANTTANSCADNSCCAAARSPRRRDMHAPRIATSFTRISAGSSAA